MIDSRLEELAIKTLDTAQYMWNYTLDTGRNTDDFGHYVAAASRIVVAVWERQNKELDDHNDSYLNQNR